MLFHRSAALRRWGCWPSPPVVVGRQGVLGWSFRQATGGLGADTSAGASPGAPLDAQPRATRSRQEQRRRGLQGSGGRPAQAAPEVSPRRKRRYGSRRPRRHATDLEDLDAEARAETPASPGAASPSGAFLTGGDDVDVAARVPYMREKHIRRLVQRPVAMLPRTPQFFVRFGPPMTVEDLSHDAPSVFVESRRLIDDVLERRQAMQASPDYVAPDTPFWRLPPKALNKKAVKWRDGQEENQGESVVTGAPRGEKGTDASEGSAEAVRERVADSLQGISDLKRTPRKWQAEALAPSRCAADVLSNDAYVTGGEANASSTSHRDSGDAKAELAGAREHRRRAPQKRSCAPAQGLVLALRQRAEEYARTGVNPDVRRGLEEALAHHPGTERAARLREMRACVKDFEALVLEGRASVANCNALIRARALQGDMGAAMRAHDAMKTHGYDPDDGTFVSLLVGAAEKRDPALARQFFLKMREQLISPTPKVYASLINAHARAGDVASAFGLISKMEDEQVKPDVVVYTVLINGLVAQGHLSRAWDEFHSIRTWKLIQPDEVLFTVMIKACALAEEPERALNMLDDLRTCGLYPTDITYGELIHAMASSADHARKAFDFFRQMKAEDMPIPAFVFEKLLQACRSLGEARRAVEVVREMQDHRVELEPAMYCHLVGLFAVAIRRTNVAEHERLQNLRSTWHVVAAARRCAGLDWTRMLNEVMAVYIAAKFPNYAVDMLQQYGIFNVQPNAETYALLLRMFSDDLKDVGRFFSLWEVVPKEPKPPAEWYHLALGMALESRSSRRTCMVLEEMCAAEVFPNPQLAERLAQVGRHVTQIHLLVARLVALNKAARTASAKRETAMLQTHIDERELRLATQGLTVHNPTPEQEARAKHFEYLHKRGYYRRPWLPFGDYLASKAKGGEKLAKRDKPRPNLLAA